MVALSTQRARVQRRAAVRAKQGRRSSACNAWLGTTLPCSHAPSLLAFRLGNRPTLVHTVGIQLLPQLGLLRRHSVRVNSGDRHIHTPEGTVGRNDSAVLIDRATLVRSHKRTPFFDDMTFLLCLSLLLVRPILGIGGSVPSAVLGRPRRCHPGLARRTRRGIRSRSSDGRPCSKSRNDQQ